MSYSFQPSSALEYSWEALWAPYDEASYQAVLSYINPQDIVVDIGAGDLRLAKRMAVIAALVYAIEIQQAILEKAGPPTCLPKNLKVINADARTVHFPSGITTAVLLMRHCTHFDLYVKKILAAGCSRLITNARWGSGLEMIDLLAPRQTFEDLDIGWYACLCGATGFKTGSLELLRPETAFSTAELRDCPRCKAYNGCATKQSQQKWEEEKTLESIPISPDLQTDIKTLYQEGV
jgi:hypothetical protein